MYVCMYLCTCMYVRMYMNVCMYVCTNLCMYVSSMNLCMYVLNYVWIYVCMYVCTYVWIYVCMYAWIYVCMYVCMYVCTYKRKFSITYNDSAVKRSQPVPVQVWLLLLCWRKREALINQMEKSHHIFMEYLFIRFQHNSFLMSTTYLQYLLKILSVTLSAQVSPVTPTIPGHTEQFQTCVAAASNLR